MRFLSVTCFVLLLSGGICLWGQGTQVAQIAGTVHDSSGAAVPGAEVKATQTSTGISRSVISGNDGTYTMTNLAIGPYRLQVTMTGFSTYVQEGIVLQVNSNPVINAVLKVGAITDQVTVEANAAMVETRSTGVGQVIDQDRVVELPLNGRQVSQLVTLSGGATEFVPTSAGQSLASNKNYPTVAAFSVAGGQGGQTLFLLDGNVNMDPMSNVGLPLPFPDALQEFKVETSSLPANYGMSPGGVVNVVTKSGGNKLHGDAFEFIRNYRFNATNTFAAKGPDGLRLSDGLKRNTFGGVIGGPIVKNKMFFFGGYQGTRENVTPASNINYVETAATLLGDFTQITSPACNGGKQITLKAPFVNNKVSASSLNPVALNLLSYIPVSVDPCGKFTYPIPNSNHENQFVTKVDWQINDKNAAFIRYFFTDYQHPQPFSKENLLTTSVDAAAGLAGRVQTAVIGHTFTISSRTVNVLHVGYTRSSMIRYDSPDMPTSTTLGVNVAQLGPPFITWTISNYFQVAAQNCNPGPWVSNNFHFSDELSMIRGRHQLSVGANWVHSQLNSLGSFQMNGIFTANGQTTGNALADFMTGQPSSFGQDNGQIGRERANIPSLFVQDNMRINSHLTANAGIRWDPFFLPYHAENKASIFDIGWWNAGIRSKVFTNAPMGTLFYGDPGMPGSSYAQRRLAEFSPRIGLVYDPRGKGQETLRIGYGIFYATTPLFLQLGIHSPYTLRLSIPSPPGGLSDPYKGSVYGKSPFPWPDPPAQNITFPAFGSGLGSFKLDLKPTYMEQWNLAVQKQLPGDWMVSATYLGNRTVHLNYSEAQNPAIYIPGNCVTGQYGLTKDGPCSNTSNTNYRRVLYMANPSQGQYYGGLSNFGDGGNANYNGLLVSAQHRFAHNFSILVNDTWSHCLTESEVGLNGAGGGQDPNNRHAEYANCLSGRRQTFNLTAVLRTPKFGSVWTQRFLGNWQASPIFTAMSGNFNSVSLGVDNSLTGGGDRPNLVGNPNLSNPTIAKWFDTSVFVTPTLGTFGNAGRGIILAPGAWNMDISLARSFQIREGQKFDFRWETFNVMNHARLGNPVTSRTSGVFGQIQTARDPRIMQFALKYTF